MLRFGGESSYSKRAVLLQLAATIYVRQKFHPLNPYASNWLERLRRIRQLRERITAERKKHDPTSILARAGAPLVDDFSDFLQEPAGGGAGARA